MPYCNQCGRYIGGGMLCRWCGEGQPLPEEPPTIDAGLPMVSMPVPDGEEPKNTQEIAGEEPKISEAVVENEAPVEMPREDACAETEVSDPTPACEEEEVPPPTEEAAEPVHEVPPPPRERDTYAFFDIEDYTDRYSQREVREGKCMAILSYLWFLWLIPYLCARRSRYVRFHLNEALPWLLSDCIALSFGGIAVLMASFAPLVAPVFAALAEVILLLSFAMKCWGVIGILRGKVRKLSIKTD